ncbi:hypothetical protein SAY87_007332 [Trapa incisa]|uniref:Small auxin up regulated protein n=1 Tax=Trapa incisa TaxID=236973 RepID=A0AAN7Q5J1_9MYRT|nr:hypothetical protein SAY87_007332 [Trapa incisa]
MGIHLRSITATAKQALRLQSLAWRSTSTSPDRHVPRGHVTVYVEDIDDQKVQRRERFLVPVAYLNQPLFRGLLARAEEEFGFDHPPGGLTIPCREDAFWEITSQLHASRSRKRD